MTTQRFQNNERSVSRMMQEQIYDIVVIGSGPGQKKSKRTVQRKIRAKAPDAITYYNNEVSSSSFSFFEIL